MRGPTGLSLHLTVSRAGKSQFRWIEGGEIVLLPSRLDESVKKEPLTELGEEGVAKAGEDAARDLELAAGGIIPVEAEGQNVAQEVEGENGRGAKSFPRVVQRLEMDA